MRQQPLIDRLWNPQATTRAVLRNGSAILLGLLLVGCAGPPPPATGYVYDKPLLSAGAQFAAVPPAVQNTIRAETGSAQIANIVRGATDGRIIYRVYFENSDRYPPLNVAADGSLLNPDLTVAIAAPPEKPKAVAPSPVSGLTLNDVPTAVAQSIQRQAPDAAIASIVKEVYKDKTTYWVTFKDHLHPQLHLASDGTNL